jgi:DNA-binding XRE family transcriptional regulator
MSHIGYLVSITYKLSPLIKGLSLTYLLSGQTAWPLKYQSLRNVVYRRFVYRRWTFALQCSQNSHVQQLLLKLGKRVRALRLDRGWTQEELAHRSGLNRSYMSDIERGRSDVSLSTLHKIARPLGIPLAELLTGIG